MSICEWLQTPWKLKPRRQEKKTPRCSIIIIWSLKCSKLHVSAQIHIYEITNVLHVQSDYFVQLSAASLVSTIFFSFYSAMRPTKPFLFHHSIRDKIRQRNFIFYFYSGILAMIIEKFGYWSWHTDASSNFGHIHKNRLFTTYCIGCKNKLIVFIHSIVCHWTNHKSQIVNAFVHFSRSNRTF